MHIGVPRERRLDEYRVGLTPAGVELLTAADHVCHVEHDAGCGAGFSDVDYQIGRWSHGLLAGEAYGRADLVFKVSPLTSDESKWLRDDSIVMGFLHLVAGAPDVLGRPFWPGVSPRSRTKPFSRTAVRCRW